MKNIEKNNSILIIIIISILLILGLGSYLIYDKINDDNKSIEENDNNENSNENDDNNSILSAEEYDLALKLYDKVTGIPQCFPLYGGNNLVDYYIEGKLTPEIILKVGYMVALEEQDTYVESLPGFLVEQQIKNIFGNNINYKFDSLYRNDGYIYAEYYQEKDEFEVITGCGSDPWSDEKNILTMVANVSKKDNKLYVVEKMIYKEVYCFYDEELGVSYCKTDIYKDYQKSNKIITINPSITMNEYIKTEQYIKDGSTYLYTFTKENDKYYFTDFKKMD